MDARDDMRAHCAQQAEEAAERARDMTIADEQASLVGRFVALCVALNMDVDQALEEFSEAVRETMEAYNG